MMNPLTSLLLVALLAPGSPSVVDSAAEARSDARLDVKVTLQLKRTPLSEVAARLASEAGVPLRVAPEAADEPVVLWVTDQPAREVMRQLALLFQARWVRAGAREKPYYELRPRPEAKDEETALHRLDRERAVAALAKRVGQAVPEDAAAGNPRLSPYLVETGAVQRLAGQLQPAQWQALLAGQALWLSTVPGKGAGPLPEAVARTLQRALVERLPLRNDLPADVLAQMEQRRQEELSPENAVRIRLYLDLTGGNRATLEVHTEIMRPGGREGMVSSVLSLVGAFRDGDPQPPDAATLAAWAADPLLGRKRSLTIDRRSLLPPVRQKLRTQPARLYELLPLLADGYAINLVADAYVAQRMPYPQPPDRLADLPLHEFLTRYALPVSTWRKEGDFIQLRSRTWHRDRLAEVPDRVTLEWFQRLRERRHLLLEDLLVLVQTLRDEQLEQLEPLLDERGVHLGTEMVPSWMAYARRRLGRSGNREIVLALAHLTPQQRQALQRGGKVDLGQLPGAARGWLASALERRYRDRLSDEGAPGKVLPGELALSLETTQVFMTLQAGERPRWEVRFMDGPRAGTAFGYGQSGSPTPPDFPKQGQREQHLLITYASRHAAPASFFLELPAVWIDPATDPKPEPSQDPATRPSPDAHNPKSEQPPPLTPNT